MEATTVGGFAGDPASPESVKHPSACPHHAPNIRFHADRFSSTPSSFQ